LAAIFAPILLTLMEYIRFNKLRTPFQPNVRQVIYFDVFGIGQKVFLHLMGEGYSRLRQLFRDAGLEFVYLPKITEDLNIRSIYRYFKPDATEQEIIFFKSRISNMNLLEFIDDDLRNQHIRPGLIQYMGREWDRDGHYIFSYEPLPEELADMMYYEPERGIDLVVQDYISRHSLSGVTDFTGAVASTSQSENKTQTDTDGDLMSEAQRLVERLRSAGIEGLALQELIDQVSRNRPTISKLRVKGGKFYLVSYKEEDGRNEKEVKMPTLSRLVYHLYLLHPEGIAFRDVRDFRQELLGLYGMYTGRESQEEIEKSIDDLINTSKNSLSEKCSRIRKAFKSIMDDSLAKNYYIDGPQGGTKTIPLNRNLVIWD